MTLDALAVFARVLHIFSIMIWMGHNYANVIRNPRFEPVQPTDPGRMMAAMKKEHGTFRYASLVALVTGIYMLWHRGILLDALTLSGNAAVIGMGVWTGGLMIVNLWCVLWPNQRIVLGFVPAPDEERIRRSRITFLSSRTNSILSMATLFFMVSGVHGVHIYY